MRIRKLETKWAPLHISSQLVILFAAPSFLFITRITFVFKYLVRPVEERNKKTLNRDRVYGNNKHTNLLIPNSLNKNLGGVEFETNYTAYWTPWPFCDGPVW